MRRKKRKDNWLKKMEKREEALDKKFPQDRGMARIAYDANMARLLRALDRDKERKMLEQMSPEAIDTLDKFLRCARGRYLLLFYGHLDLSLVYWPARVVSLDGENNKLATLISIDVYGVLTQQLFNPGVDSNVSMRSVLDNIDIGLVNQQARHEGHRSIPVKTRSTRDYRHLLRDDRRKLRRALHDSAHKPDVVTRP